MKACECDTAKLPRSYERQHLRPSAFLRSRRSSSLCFPHVPVDTEGADDESTLSALQLFICTERLIHGCSSSVCGARSGAVCRCQDAFDCFEAVRTGYATPSVLCTEGWQGTAGAVDVKHVRQPATEFSIHVAFGNNMAAQEYAAADAASQ